MENIELVQGSYHPTGLVGRGQKVVSRTRVCLCVEHEREGGELIPFAEFRIVDFARTDIVPILATPPCWIMPLSGMRLLRNATFTSRPSVRRRPFPIG
jgi:hypothetical protein